ncbi:MAG: hypothetical protein DWP97_14485 [Calditrichaeota bacterium]|nr:MAG: hypothetical protein DWP97_14485 [Calditrichota bacterium]
MTEVIDVRNYQNRLSTAFMPETSDFDKQLTALLWHCELAGKLSDNDSAFLDRLTNNQFKLFLVKDTEFIYPPGFDLIKPSDIESEWYHTANAFFSYNLHLEDGKIVNISTSPINSSKTNRITLGMIAPMELAETPEIEDTFLNISQSFREKFQSIQKELLSVQSALESDNAVMIVSRETGCLIAVNEMAKQYLNKTHDDLLTVKFSQFQKEMAETHSNLMLNIANLHIENKDISIVTLSEKESQNVTDTDTNLFITDQMTNHLSHVMLAYSDLMENFQKEDKDDNAKLIESSLSELTKINQFIRMYNLLNKIENIESERVHLLSHLEYSIDTTAPEVCIQNEELLEDEVFCAPKNSIRILFEISLTALLSNKSAGSSVQVFCYNDQNPKLVFTIDKIQLGRVTLFKNYFTLLKQLSKKIGAALTNTINTNNQTIDLTITFSKGEIK